MVADNIKLNCYGHKIRRDDAASVRSILELQIKGEK